MKYIDLTDEARQVAHDWMQDNTDLCSYCDMCEANAITDAWESAGFEIHESDVVKYGNTLFEIESGPRLKFAEASINTLSGNVGIVATATPDGGVSFNADLRQVDDGFICNKLPTWMRLVGTVAQKLLDVYSWNFRESNIEKYADRFDFNADGTPMTGD